MDTTTKDTLSREEIKEVINKIKRGEALHEMRKIYE